MEKLRGQRVIASHDWLTNSGGVTAVMWGHDQSRWNLASKASDRVVNKIAITA